MPSNTRTLRVDVWNRSSKPKMVSPAIIPPPGRVLSVVSGSQRTWELSGLVRFDVLGLEEGVSQELELYPLGDSRVALDRIIIPFKLSKIILLQHNTITLNIRDIDVEVQGFPYYIATMASKTIRNRAHVSVS